jgi:hypothetical protein
MKQLGRRGAYPLLRLTFSGGLVSHRFVKDLRSGGSIELDGRVIQKKALGHLSHGRWRRSRSRLSDGRGGLEVVSPLLVPR